MKRAGLLTLALLICWCVWMSPGSVYAQDADPNLLPWRNTLSCPPAQQAFRGVEFCTAASGAIYVVVVDAHSPGVRIEYVIAEGVNQAGVFGECNDVNIPDRGLVRGGCAERGNPAYYPVASLEQAVTFAQERNGQPAMVINSDYGAGTQGDPGEYRGHGPEGLTVVRGERLDGPKSKDFDSRTPDPNLNNAVLRPWLVVSPNAPLQVEIGIFDENADHGDRPHDWVYTGVGGGPWLIRNGVIQENDVVTCKNTPGSCYDGAMQTAVGLSQDHHWLYFVIDRRGGQLIDLATLMLNDLIVYDAIKFDGGGSSQLWYRDRVVEGGDGRQLSQYLAILAEPGNGIEIAPPPTPPSSENGWWQGLQSRVQTWWDEQRARLERAVDEQVAEWQASLEQWWQEQQEKMIQEAQRRAEEMTTQLCGGNALIGVVVAAALLHDKRRKKK